MTIDEAIAHAREVAEKQRKDNDNCEYKSQYGCEGCADYYSKQCIECAEEHEQLAEWLEELKAYRAHIFSGEMTRTMLKEQYCKAVDDFVKLFKNKTSMENRLVDEITKQLKAGGENISSNEWITISERLPNPETYVLLSFENVSIPVIGRYEQDKDGGAFYAGDEDETLTSQDMYVNAWMPLPEPYKESEDIARNNR